MMQHYVIQTSDPRWNEALRLCDYDFYHLPAYVALEARRQHGRAIGIVVQEKDKIALFPLIVRYLPAEYRSIAPEVRDATSPYGYPCPLFSKGCVDDTEFVLSCFREFVGTMRELSIVSAFLRLHPLIPLPRIEDSELGITTVDHSETAWIDLSKPEREILRSTRKTHRNLISRSRREGFVARKDESLEHIDTFGKIYRDTMARLNATADYFFDDTYFRGLSSALGNALHLWVVEKDGDIAAAGLFPVCNGIVQYHLSGTNHVFEKVSPTRLMIAEVRDWAITEGHRVLHLGGGLGSKEDGLFHFKAGFTRDRAIFSSMRLIAMKETYRTLEERWESLSGETRTGVNGFFPVFRKPIKHLPHDRILGDIY